MRGYSARECLEAGSRGLSRRSITQWLMVVLTFVVLSRFLGGGSYGHGPVFIAMILINTISWNIVFGMPVMYGASILFATDDARQASIVKGQSFSDTQAFAQRFVVFFLLFSVILMGAVGGLSLSLGVMGLEYVGYATMYLIGILVSSFIASLLTCPMAAFLVLTFDDSRKSILLGSLLFFIIAWVSGLGLRPSQYPEIALFGPAQLYRGIVVLLSGLGSASPSAMEYYFGVSFDALLIVVPIIIWTLLSLVFIRASIRLFKSNKERWKLEVYSGVWREQPVDSTEETQFVLNQEHAMLRRTREMILSLEARRQTAIAVIALVIILFPILSFGYTSIRQEEWYTVVYESPEGGEYVEIGQWLYGSFTGIDPAENIDLALGCQGDIIQGGGGSDGISMNFEFRQMLLSEFLLLNESELEDQFGRSTYGNPSSRTSFSTGWQGPVHETQYVWALRFLDVGGQTEGSIRVSFKVIMRAL